MFIFLTFQVLSVFQYLLKIFLLFFHTIVFYFSCYSTFLFHLQLCPAPGFWALFSDTLLLSIYSDLVPSCFSVPGFSRSLLCDSFPVPGFCCLFSLYSSVCPIYDTLRGIFLFFLFFTYYIQHCFICRPSDSTVPTDAGI
jgi:hypothetical protein